MTRGGCLAFVAVGPFWLAAYIFGGWVGVLVMAVTGVIGELLLAWSEWRYRLRHPLTPVTPPAPAEPEQRPEPSKIDSLQLRAEAMLLEHRSRGERGMVVVDAARDSVTWLPTSTRPFIGPEGRA